VELKTARQWVDGPTTPGLVTQALDAMAWLDPGVNDCDWEFTKDPTDEPDDAGARLVSFAFRVRRALTTNLRAILDPQSWATNSAFMKKSDAVDPSDLSTTPLDQDVPQKADPPEKGSDWTPPPPLPPLFEHFEVPLSLGAFQFLQTFTIAPQVKASSYSFDYQLERCRWSVIGLNGGRTGGIVRNQGTLTSQEQLVGGQTWTEIFVNKSFRVARDDFSQQEQDTPDGSKSQGGMVGAAAQVGARLLLRFGSGDVGHRRRSSTVDARRRSGVSPGSVKCP
jgi:hypothetical protein